MPLLDANRDRDLIDILPDYLAVDITFSRQHASKFYSRVVDTIAKRRIEDWWKMAITTWAWFAKLCWITRMYAFSCPVLNVSGAMMCCRLVEQWPVTALNLAGAGPNSQLLHSFALRFILFGVSPSWARSRSCKVPSTWWESVYLIGVVRISSAVIGLGICCNPM